MADPAAPASPPSSSPKPAGEPRYVVLLILTVFGTALGAMAVALAFGALLTFASPIVGTIVGLVVGLGLPLFLALRANVALKRRKRGGVLLRRLVVMFLIGATQLALFGAVLNWSSRTTGNIAWTAHEVLDVVGGLPIFSDMLYAHAEATGSIPGTAPKQVKPTPAVGPDGGPVLNADGGVVYVDAGPAPQLVDGGAAGVNTLVDGGAAATHIVGPSARGPAPIKPKAGIPLSPRTAGKAVRTFAAAVTTNAGDSLLLVGTIAAGGALTWRAVDLAAHDKLGDITIAESAEDGHAAAVMGGHLVMSRPGRTTAEHVKLLAPGQKLTVAGNAAEIQALRDVVIGPGGAGLAIVGTLAGGGELHDVLVTVPKPGSGTAPVVVRAAGEKVPGSNDATVVKTWSFKKSSGAPTVLIAETYLEGGDDIGTRLSGENWSVNPQRLLSVKLDSPRAQIELARTGQEPSGVAGFELQIFGDAWLLSDGRALFDANYLEQGAHGWLFVAKQGGVFALAAEKRESDTAHWSVAAPRARSLEAAADGTFVFRRSDGAAVVSSVDRPSEAIAALLGADALSSEGNKVGSVVSVDVPSLARGEWLFASATVKGNDGVARDAIVLASKQDVQNGKCEVLVEVGGAVPGTAAAGVAPPKPGAPPPAPKIVQSIRYGKGREELLWP